MKSILLIGLGKFGHIVAKELNNLGHEVMGIDLDERKVQDSLEYVTNAQIGDGTDLQFLKTLGISNYDVCIVAIGGDFQSSLETTYQLKELGAKFVVARAEREVQEKFLLRNGADEVVNPLRQIAGWTALRYSSDHLLDYIQVDEDYGIFEVTIPDEWIGKTIEELAIRKKYNINVLAIKENGKMEMTITADTILNGTNTLLVLGTPESVRKCFKM